MNPSAAARRQVLVYDHRGNCIHVGSVTAASDADGLRAVLSGPPPCPLEASRHYRVRVGSAVASSAGDEFARTAGESGNRVDTAAGDAKMEREKREHDEREAQRVRREAEGALKGFLKDKLAARRREQELLGRGLDPARTDAYGAARSNAGPYTGKGYQKTYDYAADCYGYSVGAGGGGAVFSGDLCDFSRPGLFEVVKDPTQMRIRFQEMRRCSKCGDPKIGLQDYSDSMAQVLSEAVLEQEARELIDDCFQGTNFPCPSGSVSVSTRGAGGGGITGIGGGGGGITGIGGGGP